MNRPTQDQEETLEAFNLYAVPQWEGGTVHKIFRVDDQYVGQFSAAIEHVDLVRMLSHGRMMYQEGVQHGRDELARQLRAMLGVPAKEKLKDK